MTTSFACSFQDEDSCNAAIQKLWSRGIHVLRVANTVSVLLSDTKAQSASALIEELGLIPAKPVGASSGPESNSPPGPEVDGGTQS